MFDIIVVGSYVQDLAFKTTQFPGVGETRIGTFAQGPGGKGFNQAVASARVGGKTLFIGAVGDDVFASSAKDFAASVGLQTRLQARTAVSTGAASIVVDGKGDNQIVVALGANGVLEADWVEAASDAFASARVVLVQLEANLGAMEKALELGQEKGAITVLNIAPINDDLHLSMLEKATVVTPNETEFAFVYERKTGKSLGADFLKVSDRELHLLCRELEVPVVVVTLGEAGSFVSVADGELPRGLSLGGESHLRVAPIKAKPVDTTGAGDAFNGGFAAGLVRYDGDIASALRLASAVAGLSVEKPGTAPSMPSEADVFSRLG